MIHISSDESVFTAAALGDQPGRWPLPAAVSPRQHWLRAVAAAGQGRYGSAYANLDAVIRTASEPRLVSLADSARASFLRQLGWHDLARGLDGRALASAGDDPEATADALTGLAADALGVGRLRAAAVLLARADPVVRRAPHRVAVRREWVAAELAMVSGAGDVAVRHAESAVELTADRGAARHAAKSQVVLAAALCSAGNLDRARDVAGAALELTGGLRLVPLRWALACLLGDLADDDRRAEMHAVRDDCAQRVERWGGRWRRVS